MSSGDDTYNLTQNLLPTYTHSSLNTTFPSPTRTLQTTRNDAVIDTDTDTDTSSSMDTTSGNADTSSSMDTTNSPIAPDRIQLPEWIIKPKRNWTKLMRTIFRALPNNLPLKALREPKHYWDNVWVVEHNELIRNFISWGPESYHRVMSLYDLPPILITETISFNYGENKIRYMRKDSSGNPLFFLCPFFFCFPL
jgi:hypothetical protein